MLSVGTLQSPKSAAVLHWPFTGQSWGTGCRCVVLGRGGVERVLFDATCDGILWNAEGSRRKMESDFGSRSSGGCWVVMGGGSGVQPGAAGRPTEALGYMVAVLCGGNGVPTALGHLLERAPGSQGSREVSGCL